MTMTVGAILGAVLFAIGLLHAYWGLGGVWPGTDAAACARTVGGFPGANSMPSAFACFAVAVVLAIAALVAPAAAGIFATPFQRTALAGVAMMVAVVFIGRGIAGFTPAWRRLTPEQPFARLDQTYYSPLCLAIGAGYAIVAIGGFGA